MGTPWWGELKQHPRGWELHGSLGAAQKYQSNGRHPAPHGQLLVEDDSHPQVRTKKYVYYFSGDICPTFTALLQLKAPTSKRGMILPTKAQQNDSKSLGQLAYLVGRSPFFKSIPCR